MKSKGSQGPDVGDPGHHPGAIPRSPCRLSGAPDNSHPILLTFFPRKGWELERREAGRSHTLATPGRRLQRPAIGPPQVPSCPSMPRAHSPRSARIAPHTQGTSALCPSRVPGCPPGAGRGVATPPHRPACYVTSDGSSGGAAGGDVAERALYMRLGSGRVGLFRPLPPPPARRSGCTALASALSGSRRRPQPSP